MLSVCPLSWEKFRKIIICIVQLLNFPQVKRALKEQQEVNSQLRSYIDGILMNIMEKYPELLEVRKWSRLCEQERKTTVIQVPPVY